MVDISPAVGSPVAVLHTVETWSCWGTGPVGLALPAGQGLHTGTAVGLQWGPAGEVVGIRAAVVAVVAELCSQADRDASV